MEIINGMKFVRFLIYNRCELFSGRYDMYSGDFDSKEGAVAFARRFSKKFSISVTVVTRAFSPPFLRIQGMRVSELRRYYNEAEGCYMLPTEGEL